MLRFILPLLVSGCTYETVLTIVDPIEDTALDSGITPEGWYTTNFGEEPYKLLAAPVSACFALDGESMEVTDFHCNLYNAPVEVSEHTLAAVTMESCEGPALALPQPIQPLMLVVNIPEGVDALCRLTLNGDVVREVHAAP